MHLRVEEAALHGCVVHSGAAAFLCLLWTFWKASAHTWCSYTLLWRDSLVTAFSVSVSVAVSVAVAVWVALDAQLTYTKIVDPRHAATGECLAFDTLVHKFLVPVSTLEAILDQGALLLVLMPSA